MQKLSLYFYTIRHLRLKQIFFRAYYSLRNGRGYAARAYQRSFGEKQGRRIFLIPTIVHRTRYKNGVFSFLNRSKMFTDIDWNDAEHGKLWCYNLNYFEYLNQAEISTQSGLALMRHFIDRIGAIETGLDPYPTSLRIMNWIKFIARYEISDSNIDKSLYAQTQLLSDRLEYHLMGNHLLENGCALLFSSIYFGDRSIYQKARRILVDELREQILSDGGHYELSPMYHQILLERVLDCLNMAQNNGISDEDLCSLLRDKAALMFGWLRQITFVNGDIPLVNDAANGIAPSSKELFEYAQRLGITVKTIALGDSGYRKIRKQRYEMVLDVGNIGPDYIPGHAHSDTFNFVLYVDNNPFIVDTGISTYEANDLRLSQRRTEAHNTVQVEGMEQSEVWGSFRVARRAYVRELQEEEDQISAVHTGYKHIGASHRRQFFFTDRLITIMDHIALKKRYQCKAFLHFHPSIEVKEESGSIIANGRPIIFYGHRVIKVDYYNYAPEFNLLIPAKRVTVYFHGDLKTEIYI